MSSHPRKNGETFILGGASGILTSTLLQPLDVIRTQMQAQRKTLSLIQSAPITMKEVVMEIVRKNGVLGLWRGTGPTCLRVGLGAGIYFSLLDFVMAAMWSVKDLKDPQEGISVGANGEKREVMSAGMTVLAGALTRSTAAALLCPVTVVKTRMEYFSGKAPVYSGTFNAIWTIAQKEGTKGLFSGLGPTLLRDAPYSGLYLLLYSRLRTSVAETILPLGTPQGYSNLIAGGTAGAVSTLLTHPPDVVRTRLQLAGGGQVGLWNTVAEIKRTQGLKGFFRGVSPRVTKRAMQQALTWTLFEEFRRLRGTNDIWKAKA